MSDRASGRASGSTRDSTSDAGLDFDPDELAMLRQLFRAEAQDALESVTSRVLAAGSSPPTTDALTEMMRVTHTLKGAAGTVGLEAMVELAHRLEGAFAAFAGAPSTWTPRTADEVVEIIDALRTYLETAGTSGSERLADGIRDRIDQLARRDRAPSTEASTEASGRLVPEPVLAPASDGAPVPEPKALLRVESERLDDLMSSAGELLFDRTRLERRVQLLRTLARDLARTRQSLHDALGDGSAPPSRAAIAQTESELAGQATLLSQTTAALLDELEALRRTIGQLQQGLTRIRMESARSLMAHAARTLRALRRATGIHVELRTIGEDTEFDKAVAEQLVDPLTQLLRNAVAHGVEPASERVANGKPPVPTITIRARQDGNLLVLDVSDDGRGIDTAALRRRLVATGRWTAARAELANDAEILDALLDTGVSVRGDADALAGRGIGIGLVRQAVAKLGGELGVSSVPGRGTTFTMRLPLSTALAQAMLFKVSGQVYAIPNVHVLGTMLVEPGVTSVAVRHEQVPVLRLEHLLGYGAPHGHGPGYGHDTERRPGVVVSFAGRTLVCTVDKVVGPREIIVKPVGPLLAPLSLYAGATISGSGKVQLILDPAQLVHRAYPDAPTADITDPVSGPLVLAGRALVVDDSPAIREAMTSMLGREGWIVDVAEDGARALQMSRQLRYDLVVTDLEMPALGGFDLVAHLRKDERYRATPVLIITSRVSPEHRRQARDLGVRAFVAKPITRRKLLEALASR